MKIRNRTIQRPTTVERGGREYQVNESVTVREPVIRDVDVIVARAVTAATLLIVCIALTWSVVSIGDLLSSSAPTWAAYLVATAFDMAWIVAMASEWLLRYDRRAVVPRRAGWAMLAVSMASIATHGALHAGIVIGVIGAAVSLLAKSLWLVTMAVRAHPLGEIDRQVVEQRRSEISGELALATVERELIRTRRTTAALETGTSLVGAAWEAAGLTRDQLAEAVSRSVSREPESDVSPAQLSEPPRSEGIARLEELRERLTARKVMQSAQAPAITGGSAAQLSSVSPAHEPVSRESDVSPAQLSEPDAAQAQVEELSRRINAGERLTKSSAAQILGVSEATAGRRLREARSGGGYL